jgi:Fe-Mn family superoxide dismutase
MAAMRGIGWVVLVHDKKDGRLFNTWIGEHDEGNLAGTTPLLVMDVFEHAFMVDYGLKRADYINVFMNHIDWHAVEERV